MKVLSASLALCVLWASVLGCASTGEDGEADATPPDTAAEDTGVASDPGPAPDIEEPEDIQAADEGAPDLAEPDPGPPPPPNTAPVAMKDNETLFGMAPLQIHALYNDFDPDGDWLLIESATQPEYGTVTVIFEGQQLEYTPTSNPPDGTDTFQYTITDGRGGTDTATVSLESTVVPTLKITKPAPGATINGTKMTVEFKVTGCSFTHPSQNGSGCHAHRYLDNKGGQGVYQYAPFVVDSLPAGTHSVTLQLIRNDGSDQPWSPPIQHSVTFEVIP